MKGEKCFWRVTKHRKYKTLKVKSNNTTKMMKYKR